MNSKTKSKNRLAELIQQATSAEIQLLACLHCGGSLSIQFVSSGPKGKGAGTLSIMCKNCVWRVISDGILNEPPWVAELGSKIRTEPRTVATKIKGR